MSNDQEFNIDNTKVTLPPADEMLWNGLKNRSIDEDTKVIIEAMSIVMIEIRMCTEAIRESQGLSQEKVQGPHRPASEFTTKR